jgi:uncharacterized protein involved in oxidation of intracellular sulfur
VDDSVKALLVLNDPPYGTERCYNALRWAGALAKREDCQVRVFLMGDAAGCAKAGQSVPQGFYNLSRMLRVVIQHRGEVGVCSSCLDARGLREPELVEGVHRRTIGDLADWTDWADKVLVF